MSQSNISYRHLPFIKYGNDVSGFSDVKSALIASDMYWKPQISDISTITTARIENDKIEHYSVTPNDYRMIYRGHDNGTIDFIAPVKSRYTVSDPIKNFMTFDEWVKEGRMSLISAGNMENKFLWMFSKIIGANVRIGDDDINWHMLAYDKLDGGAAIHVIFMPVREYCDNGLFVLDKRGKVFELRQVHVGRSTLTVNEKIGIIMNQFDSYHRIFYAMQEERYTANIANKVYANYIKRVMFNGEEHESTKRTNIVQTIDQMAAREAEHNNGYSLWGIYNAVVEYADHVYPDDRKSQKNVYNLVMGHGARIKRNAWKEAVSLLEN